MKYNNNTLRNVDEKRRGEEKRKATGPFQRSVRSRRRRDETKEDYGMSDVVKKPLPMVAISGNGTDRIEEGE